MNLASHQEHWTDDLTTTLRLEAILLDIYSVRNLFSTCPQVTYDSLLHLIYPCSLRHRHTSSSCGHTLHSHTGTLPRGSEVSGAPSSCCIAPWTRLTCPCSQDRRRSSTGRGCTRSRCSGTHAGRRWGPSISPHRSRPRSHRRRRTRR